ncbi:MAG: hypothetical protein QG671_1380 [Actinomycetota bacterium]|nr:hypothetical protein [Actinomycetota bacterium]
MHAQPQCRSAATIWPVSGVRKSSAFWAHGSAGACVAAGIILFIGLATLAGCANSSPSTAPPSPPETAAGIATLVVPRFNGGSVPVDPAAQERFLFNRGYPAQDLRLGDTYQPLLSALRSRPGSKVVLGASYDWRMPGAPPQDSLDGKVTGLLAHWNDPMAVRSYPYAVDYLRYWLIQAARSTPDQDRVNLIAHSTGVTLVRAYLQSDAYGQTVLDENGSAVKLPTIDTLVLAVPAMQGAPFVWNLWNGNFASFVGAARGADIFRGYNTAYQHVVSGGTISGPIGDVTSASLSGVGLARQVSFLRQYNPLFRIVLPTNDFLYPSAAPEPAPISINGRTGDRNELLLDLNSGSAAGRNPWTALASKVVVTYPVNVLAPPATAGSGSVSTAISDRTETGTGGTVVPFTAFARDNQTGIPTVPGQTWFREEMVADAGDGAFPLATMRGTFFDRDGVPDPGIRVQQWGNGPSPQGRPEDTWTPVAGNLSHNLFIENPAITHWLACQVEPG